jgi:hypothetical protein
MNGLGKYLIPAVIGCTAGSLGVLAIIVLHRGTAGVDAGDLVEFVGAVLGTGLAVAGAAWIENRRRRHEAVESAEPVLDGLLRLERKSRPFFDQPGRRREHVDGIVVPYEILRRLLPLSPPRNARLIELFDQLGEGVTLLKSELYLSMDEQAAVERNGKRSRVEVLLDNFDVPLKILIVEYSRTIDSRSLRAVRHLGKMHDF